MVNTLSRVHSSNNLSEEENMSKAETKRLYEVVQRKVRSEDKYNVPFTMGELKSVLTKCKKSAPGKDGISFIMLSQLSEKGLQKLLGIYNKVWEEGKILSGWKEAVIVPIKKPGKDQSKPTSYRPIALTSHIDKLMERLVNGRLMYFMEEKELMNSCQSGFRKGRSTTDFIICLEDEIRKAQVNKESVVAIFLDVEKAYNMLWVEGLLSKMKILRVEGNVYNWVLDFLNNRSIEVKVGPEISKSV